MGWASATGYVMDVWNAVREDVPEQKRPATLAKIVNTFQNGDWDNEEEIVGVWPEAHAALCITDPEWHQLDDGCEAWDDDRRFEEAVRKALAEKGAS